MTTEDLPPVVVTYRHDRGWIDVLVPEAGGLQGTVRDQETATLLAWTALRRLEPPRGVVEVHEGL